jgi:integrase
LIAIRWSDIDFHRRNVRIQRAIVRGKAKPTTKTNTVRDVDLNDRALAAFEAQRKHTQLLGEQVFNNPATGKPWADIQMQREIWNVCLRRCKLRYRVPYQTRHTYATLALHLAGARPGYVARQLGHANTGMLFKVYSKWIDGADNARECAKLNAAFVHDLCTPRRADITTG